MPLLRVPALLALLGTTSPAGQQQRPHPLPHQTHQPAQPLSRGGGVRQERAAQHLAPLPAPVWADTAAPGIHRFLTFGYHLTPENITAHAAEYGFVWAAQPIHLPYYRRANRDAQLSFYIAAASDNCVHNLSYWEQQHPEWILRACDRTSTIPMGCATSLDFTNPAVVSWLVEAVIRPAAAAGYDAVAMDDLVMRTNWSVSASCPLQAAQADHSREACLATAGSAPAAPATRPGAGGSCFRARRRTPASARRHMTGCAPSMRRHAAYAPGPAGSSRSCRTSSECSNGRLGLWLLPRL